MRAVFTVTHNGVESRVVKGEEAKETAKMFRRIEL
jgi:hypothetical protein